MVKHLKYKYLFNFSSSYSGGGFKRLYEYSKWFNNNGGSIFIINERNNSLEKEFENNLYYIVNPSLMSRIFNNQIYVDDIINKNKSICFYYSYGIPIRKKFTTINWYHLSNVLPLKPYSIKMSFNNRLRFVYLGFLMKIGYKNAEIISAESQSSLSMMPMETKLKLFLSVNGSDDEISFFKLATNKTKENIALVIGTHWYKQISASYKIFNILKGKTENLRFIIIGKDNLIPDNIKNDPSVTVISKFLDRQDLLKYLQISKYYICTSLIENSYNAISEGIFFAKESFVSDIGVHRELLHDAKFDLFDIGNNVNVLHVKKENLKISVLKTWDEIILEMINKINMTQSHPS